MSSNSLEASSALTPDPGLGALLTATGLAPIESHGWISITGEDRVRWLNGMVTNSIQALTPGEGCYNFILSAQGRIQGDATAFLLPESLLLETDRSRLATLAALLDRFIIMDDVELHNLSEIEPEASSEAASTARCGLLIAGPHAASLLTRIGLQPPAAPIHLTRLMWQEKSFDLIHAYSPLVPRFELWADASTLRSLTLALLQVGAVEVSSESIEHLRLLEGTPLYGIDIRDRELPQETAPLGIASRALHFTKGCYLGQEIVERIHSRGNVHRSFSGFVLTGDLPAPGTSLTIPDAPGRSIGELTSVARIHLPSGPVLPSRPVQIALGYIRREVLRPLSPADIASFSYPGGSARPVSLPFALSTSVHTHTV